MNHALKHYAFRVWSAAVFGGLAGLWLLPPLEPLDWPGGALGPAGGLMLAAFMASGWLADAAARALLGPLLREAGIRERSGMHAEAETAFQRARSLMGSFLVLPRTRRRFAGELAGRMARFYLAHPDPDPDAQAFVSVYLQRHPDDRQVARGWLAWQEGRRDRDPATEELATRLGQAHGDDPEIKRRLAGIFLQGRRRDFTAIQAYRETLAGEGKTAAEVCRLAEGFLEEGRADALALETYLQALEAGADPRAFRRGLAACLRWVRASEAAAPLLARARDVLGHPGEAELIRLSTGFVPPDRPREAAPPAQREPAAHRLTAWQDALAAGTGRGWARVQTAAASRRLRRTLKWSLPAALALTAAVLLVNTARHLAPPPEPPPPAETPQQAAAPSAAPAPFTLQVAAYLQPEPAERLVRELRAQQLDAYVAKASSGSKTWYQVRLAQFQDKEAARMAGLDLKAKGIIQDFYVANNTRLERPPR